MTELKNKLIRPNKIAAVLVPTIAAVVFLVASRAEKRGDCIAKPLRDGLSGAAACASENGVSIYMPNGEVVVLNTISKPEMVTRVLAGRYIQFLQPHEGGYHMREYDIVSKRYRDLNRLTIRN
jgi:hypothetical protein